MHKCIKQHLFWSPSSTQPLTLYSATPFLSQPHDSPAHCLMFSSIRLLSDVGHGGSRNAVAYSLFTGSICLHSLISCSLMSSNTKIISAYGHLHWAMKKPRRDSRAGIRIRQLLSQSMLPSYYWVSVSLRPTGWWRTAGSCSDISKVIVSFAEPD